MPRFSIQNAMQELDYHTSQMVSNNLYALNCQMSLKYNAQVRDDSRLSYNWARNLINAPMEEVMEELVFIQWLSSHTNYQTICEDGLRQLANTIHDNYPELSWSKIWALVRGVGPDLFKYVLVDKCSAGVPDLTKVIV